MKTIKAFLVFSLLSFGGFAQNNLNFKVSTVGIYPFDDSNSDIFVNTLDNKGKLTYEPGIMISYEDFNGLAPASFEIIQGLYNDCANQVAGFTHVGVRIKMLQKFKHSLSFGFGPTLFYRNDWHTIEGYNDENYYNTTGGLQYKLAWWGGEVEYDYYLSKHGDLSLSLNLIHPKAFTIGIGYRYWISRKARRGCDCPGLR